MKKFFILAVCFAAVVFASCEPALLPNVKAYGFSVSSTKKVVFSPGNLSEWQKMERAGAAFLPAAGYRLGCDVHESTYRGFYWTSTLYKSECAWLVDVNANMVGFGYVGREFGGLVRLVKDLQ